MSGPYLKVSLAYCAYSSTAKSIILTLPAHLVTFNKKLSDASSDELRYFARQLSLFIQFILLVNKIPNKISPSKLGFTEFGCTNSEFNA